MAQVVPNPSGFGAQLGKGLSAGLSQLAEQKFAQLARREEHREKASRFRALGLPENTANYLAGIDDRLGFSAVNQFRANGGGQEEQQSPQPQQGQQAPQGGNLEKLVGNINPIPGASASPEQLMLQSLAAGKPLSPIQAVIKSLESRQGEQQGNMPQVLGGGQPEQPIDAQQVAPQSNQPQDIFAGHDMPQEVQEMIAQQEKQASTKKPSKKSKVVSQNPGELFEQVNQELTKDAASSAHDYVQEERARHKANSAMTNSLGRMESYNESGKLSYPLTAALVKSAKVNGWGLDLTFMLTPESQDYHKIATGFLKNAKQYFGSRMTQGEFETFLETIPQLTNSTEGRRLIINASKALIKAEQVMYQSMEDVIRDNGGKIPADIQIRAEQRVAKELDQLYEEFKNPSLYASKYKPNPDQPGLPPIGDYPVGKRKKMGSRTIEIVERNGKKQWKEA